MPRERVRIVNIIILNSIYLLDMLRVIIMYRYFLYKMKMFLACVTKLEILVGSVVQV